MTEEGKLAEVLLDQAEDLKAEWEWLAKRILPRKEDALLRVQEPSKGFPKRRTCAKATASLLVLANAHMSYIVATGQQWFRFECPVLHAKEKSVRWYSNATEVMYDALGRSNFNTVMHETCVDRSLFGTGAMLVEEGREGGLKFTHIPVGTFGIAENADGEIDTLVRAFYFTAKQAAERWGEDALPQEVSIALDNPHRASEKFEFVHLVKPRRTYTAGNARDGVIPEQMPYESVYMYKGADWPVMERGGYMEFPYIVTRFLKWGADVWGYPPGRTVMDEIDGLIKLERNMDFAADLAVLPRLFLDARQEGEVNYRAGGKTYLSPEAVQMNLPREWGTNNRIDYGLERKQVMENAIGQAFYVPFLQIFSTLDGIHSGSRQMTAEEVRARQSEQVISCAPTFSLFCTDLQRGLERCFALLFRQGAFEHPDYAIPAELLEYRASGDHSLNSPRVTYQGKINRAIEQAQQHSTDYAVQTATMYYNLTGGDPATLDDVNIPKMVRKLFENAGVPTECFRKETEIKELQAARAAQAQAQMELQMAQAANQQSQANLHNRQ